jgi:hypothetical protein
MCALDLWENVLDLLTNAWKTRTRFSLLRGVCSRDSHSFGGRVVPSAPRILLDLYPWWEHELDKGSEQAATVGSCREKPSRNTSLKHAELPRGEAWGR